VNHIEAHLHSSSLEHGDSPWPAVALVVSGGHSELVEVRGLGDYRWLGSTLDDAAARPTTRWPSDWASASPAVRSSTGSPPKGGGRVRPAAADARPAGLEFSFSGLKTAVSVLLAPHGEPPTPSRSCATWRPHSRRRSWRCW
jgi:N6-L-threonylcarbamoyladenine synthase